MRLPAALWLLLCYLVSGEDANPACGMVVVVMEESQSMSVEHSWLSGSFGLPKILKQFQKTGMDGMNMACVVGFSAKDIRNLGCSVDGTYESFHALKTGDGLEAVEVAVDLAEAFIDTHKIAIKGNCSAIQRRIILATDAERTVLTKAVNEASVSEKLFQRSWVFHSMLTFEFQGDAPTMIALGGESSIIETDDGGSYIISDDTNSEGIIIHGLDPYATLAWNFGGLAWNLGRLHAGRASMALFSNALVDVLSTPVTLTEPTFAPTPRPILAPKPLPTPEPSAAPTFASHLPTVSP